MSAQQSFIAFIQQMHPPSAPKAEEIAAFFTEKHFSKNDLLIQRNKTCNEYYFLANGHVRSFTENFDQEEITTGFSSSNQIVCELNSFFKRVPAKEDFQALCDCHTLSISYEGVQKAFHSMPEFREFGRAILVNAYAVLKESMLSTLQETAEERYMKLLLRNPELFQHASLKHVASYLGITDTSLSRIRKEVVKK